MSGEEFLQKLSHLCPVSYAPWPQGVKPNFGFILQCERKNLEPHLIHCDSLLLEGVVDLLKLPHVRIRLLTLHAMKSGKEWHQVRSDNHLLSWRHNAGWCTHSRRVYVDPHGSICIEIHFHCLLTLLFFRWRFHCVKIKAQFRI